MAKTDLNNIKNWFRTGLKPTQEQFWNWMDSFWHKDEKIPQSAVENLDLTLQNKADKDITDNALANKADLIAGKVPFSQLPLDETFLSGKLDKPTQQGSWVVTVAGDGAVSWSNANDFGKNIANSLQRTTESAGVVQDFNYAWNTNGNYLTLMTNSSYDNDRVGYLSLSPLSIDIFKKNFNNYSRITANGSQLFFDVNGKGFYIDPGCIIFNGLSDVTNDPTINKKLVIGSDNKIAYKDATDITVNIPDTFNSTASVATTTINVNHIFPNPVPPSPDYGTELNNIMAQYKNIQFIPITGSDVIISTPDNLDLNKNFYNSLDGNFYLEATNTIKNAVSTEPIKVITNNKLLPSSKNWVLKVILKGSFFIDDFDFLGVIQNDENIIAGVRTQSSGFGGKGVKIISNSNAFDNNLNDVTLLIVKAGNVICTQIYKGNQVYFLSTSAFTEFGDYKMIAKLNKLSENLKFKPSYYIFP